MYIFCQECGVGGEIVNDVTVRYDTVCISCKISKAKYDKYRKVGTGWYSA